MADPYRNKEHKIRGVTSPCTISAKTRASSDTDSEAITANMKLASVIISMAVAAAIATSSKAWDPDAFSGQIKRGAAPHAKLLATAKVTSNAADCGASATEPRRSR